MKLDVYFELFPSEWQKLNQIIEEAKKMEREQIVNAWENGFMSTAEGWNGEVTPEMHNETLNTEQYYNKTYGGDK